MPCGAPLKGNVFIAVSWCHAFLSHVALPKTIGDCFHTSGRPLAASIPPASLCLLSYLLQASCCFYTSCKSLAASIPPASLCLLPYLLQASDCSIPPVSLYLLPHLLLLRRIPVPSPPQVLARLRGPLTVPLIYAWTGKFTEFMIRPSVQAKCCEFSTTIGSGKVPCNHEQHYCW